MFYMLKNKLKRLIINKEIKIPTTVTTYIIIDFPPYVNIFRFCKIYFMVYINATPIWVKFILNQSLTC